MLELGRLLETTQNSESEKGKYDKFDYKFKNKNFYRAKNYTHIPHKIKREMMIW